MAREAHLKRAQSAMHEVAIVGAHAVSPVTRRILQPPADVGIRRGHCDEHDVGMSRKIFGRCSDRPSDTVFTRPKIVISEESGVGTACVSTCRYRLHRSSYTNNDKERNQNKTTKN